MFHFIVILVTYTFKGNTITLQSITYTTMAVTVIITKTRKMTKTITMTKGKAMQMTMTKTTTRAMKMTRNIYRKMYINNDQIITIYNYLFITWNLQIYL